MSGNKWMLVSKNKINIFLNLNVAEWFENSLAVAQSKHVNYKCAEVISAPDSQGHGDRDTRSENQHLRRVMRACVRVEGWWCWWLGKGWRLNGCLDSAVGASAVKLVNPEEQGISSAGGKRLGRGALGTRCPRPQCHAAGLPGMAAPPPPPPQPPVAPLTKLAPGSVWPSTLETDPHSYTQAYKRHAQTAHQFITGAAERLKGRWEESEGVFTWAHWFQCDWLCRAHRPTWGLLHIRTPLISSRRCCAAKLFLARSSPLLSSPLLSSLFPSFLTVSLQGPEHPGLRSDGALRCY